MRYQIFDPQLCTIFNIGSSYFTSLVSVLQDGNGLLDYTEFSRVYEVRQDELSEIYPFCVNFSHRHLAHWHL